MINIEDEVFTRVATALRSVFEGIFVTGEVVNAPPSFPCVSIVEQNNATYARTQTQSTEENHATMLYQVDAYSNKTTGKKSECKRMFDVIDNEMANMGFTRTFLNPITNPQDSSVSRMTGRYQAVASQTHVIYRS